MGSDFESTSRSLNPSHDMVMSTFETIAAGGGGPPGGAYAYDGGCCIH